MKLVILSSFFVFSFAANAMCTKQDIMEKNKKFYKSIPLFLESTDTLFYQSRAKGIKVSDDWDEQSGGSISFKRYTSLYELGARNNTLIFYAYAGYENTYTDIYDGDCKLVDSIETQTHRSNTFTTEKTDKKRKEYIFDKEVNDMFEITGPSFSFNALFY